MKFDGFSSKDKATRSNTCWRRMEKHVNTTAVDAVTSCPARPSAATMLTITLPSITVSVAVTSSKSTPLSATHVQSPESPTSLAIILNVLSVGLWINLGSFVKSIPSPSRFHVIAKWAASLGSVVALHLLRWRHNDHDSVSNHQPHDCLPNPLYGRRSK